MNDVIDFFSIGGPAVGGAFIATIIYRLVSERQRNQVKKMRVTADADSVAIQAANEVINLVRDELEASRTRQARMNTENERLSKENEQLKRHIHQLLMNRAANTIKASYPEPGPQAGVQASKKKE